MPDASKPTSRQGPDYPKSRPFGAEDSRVDPSVWGAPAEPLRLLFATTNPHKADEVSAILSPLNIRILRLDEIASTTGRPACDEPPPEETGETFEANAALKARAYARLTDSLCLADDSGLEVDALGGEPGVHSAHYAHGWEGRNAPRSERDPANNQKLLEAMKDVPDERRTARFVCAMALANPRGKIIATTRGEFAGEIAREERGSGGFGYDPLLLLEEGRTAAELSPKEKNERSHRGAAARAMAAQIGEKLDRFKA